MLVLIVLYGCASDDLPRDDPQPGTPDPFVDLDPAADVFEADLTARPAWVAVGDEVVQLLTYGGHFPGPEIHVVQGDRVVVHLDNQLPADFPTTIHWHGIEGTNTADGTPVTQDPVAPGERFTYAMVVPRPGIYWYHPHIRGAQGTHSGLYGTLIVDDPDDAVLTDMGVLPALRHTLVLSDLGIHEGGPISVEATDDLILMNGTEGSNLLVNGLVDPEFEVPAGGGVRLQLVNTSITRYWRLAVPGHELIRVGGEGGLLTHARVEGGTVVGTVTGEGGEVLGTDTVDLGFGRGELLLGPAERADVVLVPRGQPGEVLTLRWEDFARGRHGMWQEAGEWVMGDDPLDGHLEGQVVATFRLVAGGEPYDLAAGDPILAAIGRQVEAIPAAEDAVDFTGDQATRFEEEMEMFVDGARVTHEAEFFIDGVSWMPTLAGPDQAEAPNARHARVGDTIEWEVHNTTGMAHPFHLHGFSYQPLAFVRHDGEPGHDEPAPTGPLTTTTWPVDVVELEDTTHIPAHTSLLFRVRLDDPNGDGGAVGRWMKHCHIFQHGESGMMAELIVDP